ncbi:hypothetical protein [Oceanivirga miroungae]|uniref:Chemotaxis protein CheA n=1 Tax=Oceanivirga miroungae TaxID=1130046 RepID=A0A6I8ME36_9FUSO|nr:hypothetical protein [Oceanivirga miroungae]VWL85829.1 Chemotaxis protein CheA [Oceanivirga miroungae]
MEYKLSIELKKNINLNDNNIMLLLNNLEDEFNIENRDFIFFKTQNINEYNENKLNASISYSITSADRSIENKIHKYLYENIYISKYKLELVDVEEKTKNNINIKPIQIDNLLDDVDKIFYLRKSLETYDRYLPDKIKEKYKKDIKKLREIKYRLKASVVNLRLFELELEFNKMKTRFSDYARNLGIDFDFKFNVTNIKLDKLIFYKLKPAIKDLVYTLIELETEKRKKELVYNKLDFSISFTQDFNKLVMDIHSNHLSDNKIYKTIFNNEFEILSDDEEIREQELAILNVYSLLKDLGEVKFTDDNSLEFTTTLNFLTLNSLIIQVDLGYYAIDTNYVVDYKDFNKENIVSINNISYYKFNESHLPIIKASNEIKKALVLKIENHSYVFLVKDILHQEEIFVKSLETKSNEYLGYAILKDSKKALLINLKSYI